MKSIVIVFKSGAIIEVPYSSKFYRTLTENMGTDSVAEHPSATIKTKDIQAVVYKDTRDQIAK